MCYTTRSTHAHDAGARGVGGQRPAAAGRPKGGRQEDRVTALSQSYRTYYKLLWHKHLFARVFIQKNTQKHLFGCFFFGVFLVFMPT